MSIYRGIVVRTARLSPTLVRITLGGPGLAGFVSTGVGDEYVRVFFPHGEDQTEVSLPVPNGDWWVLPEGAPEAPMRTYTIRDARPESGEIDIDFVIHAAGIAGPWAAAAQPGHVLGLNSPTSLYRPPAETTWQVLVGDLTGLPAIARLLTQAPRGVRTRVVVEVPSLADRVELPSLVDAEVTWVVGGNGDGPSRLGEVVRSVVDERLPLHTGYIWVAGETVALRDARKYLRRELGLAARHFTVVGYWSPIAHWDSKYQALPESVQRELAAMWEGESGSDPEDLQLRYEGRLAELGL